MQVRYSLMQECVVRLYILASNVRKSCSACYSEPIADIISSRAGTLCPTIWLSCRHSSYTCIIFAMYEALMPPMLINLLHVGNMPRIEPVFGKSATPARCSKLGTMLL
eukprot:GHUV01037065.1.p1 GENE.GHUV01037065.1~~GHUV01037065.1.p1  ORF type:complete len:108 (-),score=7.56 GHUV01037065.1:31-354(-)